MTKVKGGAREGELERFFFLLLLFFPYSFPL